MYEIRKYRSGDEGKIVKLWQEVFPHQDIDSKNLNNDLELWKWRFEQNPAGKADIWLAFSDDKLVGHQMTEPKYAKINSKKQKVYYSGDSMVSKNHKGLLFLKLLNLNSKELLDENKVGIGMPNKNSQEIFVKLGWKNIGNIPLLVRPLDFSKIIKPKFLGFMLNGIYNLFDLIFFSGAKKNNLRFKEIEHFDDSINKLWESFSENLDFSIIRDSDFLNWRFCQTNDSSTKYKPQLPPSHYTSLHT